MTRILLPLVLAVLYLAVAGSVHPLDAVVGVTLGAAVTLGLQARESRRRAEVSGRQARAPSNWRRLVALLPFLAATAGEVVRGSWAALSVMAGIRHVTPGIVQVPVGPRSARGAAVSGFVLTLTPGTVLVEIDERRRTMHVHALDASRPDSVRASLDRFYERFQRSVFP